MTRGTSYDGYAGSAIPEYICNCGSRGAGGCDNVAVGRRNVGGSGGGRGNITQPGGGSNPGMQACFSGQLPNCQQCAQGCFSGEGHPSCLGSVQCMYAIIQTRHTCMCCMSVMYTGGMSPAAQVCLDACIQAAISGGHRPGRNHTQPGGNNGGWSGGRGRNHTSGGVNVHNWDRAAGEKLGGYWYSTRAEGMCNSTSDYCGWRVESVSKRVSKICADDSFWTYVEDRDAAGCFKKCPFSGIGAALRNTSDICWVKCFFDTTLGPSAGKGEMQHGLAKAATYNYPMTAWRAW
jgi:hypothetical protein